MIIISGHANIEMAIKSLKSGAFEFIQKPFDQERLMNFVNRAVENFNLKNQNKELQTKLNKSQYEGNNPVSPGLFKKHYSPHAALRINADFPYEEEGWLGFGKDPKNIKSM